MVSANPQAAFSFMVAPPKPAGQAQQSRKPDCRSEDDQGIGEKKIYGSKQHQKEQSE
jgi:hypothetical protein